MKLLSIVLFSILALGVLSRRLNHLNTYSLLSHYTEDDITNIEKKIFKDVLTDKDISQLITDGKTNDEGFKTTILKKTLDIVSGNEEYLKSLSGKVFEGASVNINDEDRTKVLKLLLKDQSGSQNIINGKQSQTLKRITELIRDDNDLVQSIGKQAKLDSQNKLSEAQKVALLKVYLNNPSLFGKQVISSQQLTKILQQIQSDSDLKDFYGQSQENKDYISSVLNKNR